MICLHCSICQKVTLLLHLIFFFCSCFYVLLRLKPPISTINQNPAVGCIGMGVGREVAISLDGVRDKNMMQLKKINTAIFPVRYNDKYYTDAIASGDFTRLAYYSDICVGSIACRLEKKESGAVRVYIMTLGVLAPYRGLGTGTKLLNHVLDLCAKQNVSDIYLHVHTINEDAINFYKKFGFEVTDKISNYYTNITPPDCFVLTKFITQTKKQTP